VNARENQVITRNSSGDEKPERDVFLFTTTSYTYYKIPKIRYNLAKFYKNFIVVKSDLQLNLKIILS